MLRFLTIAIFCFLILSCSSIKQTGFQFNKLLVEYAKNPINIDVSNPRFSWIITCIQRNQTQLAYRILVATSTEKIRTNQPDLWDLGKINSGETIQHEYAGKKLESNHNYFWKVLVWDGNGKEHQSPVSHFETAILNASEWKAGWIGNGPESEPLPDKGFYGNRKEQAEMKDTITHKGNSLLLRNEVTISKEVKSAKAFVTGLGYYEFYINGQRVGNHVLSPAKTPFHKYILYDTFNVTKLLQKGNNAFGIHLGNGWYNPYKKMVGAIPDAVVRFQKSHGPNSCHFYRRLNPNYNYRSKLEMG